MALGMSTDCKFNPDNANIKRLKGQYTFISKLILQFAKLEDIKLNSKIFISLADKRR